MLILRKSFLLLGLLAASACDPSHADPANAESHGINRTVLSSSADKTPATGDQDVAVVPMRAEFRGEYDSADAHYLYILVCPLNNPQAHVWWVQEEPVLSADHFVCQVQFGETCAGAGEHFAIAVICSPRQYETGEQLDTLPADAQCTAYRVVQRCED